jgi:hypothetical protein
MQVRPKPVLRQLLLYLIFTFFPITSSLTLPPSQDLLKKIYEFNHKREFRELKSVGFYHKNKDPHAWGGGQTRRLLIVAYTLAFLCLLWVDEVLQIQMHHITYLSDTKIKLTLPFRKTHQFGHKLTWTSYLQQLYLFKHVTDVKPFYLHMQAADQAHLCLVQALADWISISKVKEGHLFRKIWSGDQVADLDNNKAMVSGPFHFDQNVIHWSSTHLQTSEQFLELFWNNLLDVNIDHYPYRTHSFRWGGCQYFASHCRWSL